MMLLTAGVNHKIAPLALRERLAVQDPELVAVARSLKSHLDLDEIVLLSTRNRVEIYGTTRRAITDCKSLFQLLCSETEDLTPHVYLYRDVAAARHLLGVTASLDSMVLGETEITGQIKNAYEAARAGGLTGRVLNRFFQKAFQAAEEIRTRTEIGRGAVSIKSAAVELVRRIFEDDLAGRAIMVIGAGQIGRMLRSTAGQKRRPLDSDFQSLSRPRPRSGHPLGRTSSNAAERNAKAASVSMRGTFTRVTAGVFTGVSAAAVAFHFR